MRPVKHGQSAFFLVATLVVLLVLPAAARAGASSVATQARTSGGVGISEAAFGDGVGIQPETSGGAAVLAGGVRTSHGTGGRLGAGGGPPLGTSAVEPTTTIQTITQVQLSACVVRCRRISQTQFAAQQNTTAQAQAGPSPAAFGGAVAARDTPLIAGRISQIQLGCVLHCFGATTGTARSEEFRQAIERLLSGRRQAASPWGDPASLAERVIIRIARRWRTFDRRPDRHSRRPAASTTAAVASSITADIRSALAGSEQPPTGAAIRTVQRIGQVQVGCLMFCSETTQRQQAEQSNKTLSARHRRGASIASGTSSADQRIWQLQIGCLFWCRDTTEQQYARSEVGGPMSPSTAALRTPSLPAALNGGPLNGYPAAVRRH